MSEHDSTTTSTSVLETERALYHDLEPNPSISPDMFSEACTLCEEAIHGSNNTATRRAYGTRLKGTFWSLFTVHPACQTPEGDYAVAQAQEWLDRAKLYTGDDSGGHSTQRSPSTTPRS